ncbi:hypothetical protein MRX96_025738 [Rhipicephalus microplus]
MDNILLKAGNQRCLNMTMGSWWKNLCTSSSSILEPEVSMYSNFRTLTTTRADEYKDRTSSSSQTVVFTSIHAPLKFLPTTLAVAGHFGAPSKTLAIVSHFPGGRLVQSPAEGKTSGEL